MTPNFNRFLSESILVWLGLGVCLGAIFLLKWRSGLIASIRQYRDLFNYNPQPMWIVDPQTYNFLEVNEAAIRHYGYTRSEFRAMNALQIRPEVEHEIYKREVERAANQRYVEHAHIFKHLKKDGSCIDVRVAASEINFQGKRARLGLLVDITEQLSAERALREAKKAADEAKCAAESANDAKTHFLANMSHEIRTPLGAILGFADLLRDQTQTVAEREDCIRTILRNGQQLSRVVNDILDLSKIESNRLQIEAMVFNPLDVVEEVVSTLSLQAQAKSLELKITCEGAIPQKICSDSTRLRQILMNIVGNAVKFTTNGCVEITFRCLPRAGSVLLEFLVNDTGPGVSEEQARKLFKPFSQADTSTTRLFGGTGLGLVLSRRLAQALGGDLVLRDSKVGRGSCFAISIEAHVFDEKPAIDTNQGSGAETNLRALSELNVLLVEDAPDSRKLVSRFVTSAGGHIACADNGLDGVEAAMTGNFDVILMDIQMPRLDGCEALKRLRSSGYSRPIVALTAHAMKGDRERYLSIGFDDYLVKPLQKSVLVDAIGRYGSVLPATMH